MDGRRHGHRAPLTCLTCDQPQTQGVLQTLASTRGDYIYFVAGQELFVAHGASVIPIESSPSQFLLSPMSSQISDDGRTIVFSLLVAQPDFTFLPVPYRSVVGDTSASAPQCVACAPDGSAASATLGFTNNLSTQGVSANASTLRGRGVAVSADGSSIVFDSANGLGRVSGGAHQVYEWTASGGDQFVARDYGGYGAVMTPDARNIFFFSQDSLTPDAVQADTAALFDARVGGGFAPPVQPAPCSGDGCQGPSPSTTAPTVATSSACCGDAVSPPRPSVSVGRFAARTLQRARRTGRLTIALRVRGGGQLRVALSARVGGRRRTVARASRRLTGAAGLRSVAVSARLSAAARRALERDGRLAVTVTATLTGAEPTTRRITLIGRRPPEMTGGRS